MTHDPHFKARWSTWGVTNYKITRFEYIVY